MFLSSTLYYKVIYDVILASRFKVMCVKVTAVSIFRFPSVADYKFSALQSLTPSVKIFMTH